MQQCRLLYAVLGAGTLSRKLLLPPLWRGRLHALALWPAYHWLKGRAQSSVCVCVAACMMHLVRVYRAPSGK